ncbi:hypothetical protein BGW80DRAFT_1453853 [Lactifluus volemus]|nr:hypothetical protein BGW80DRAFT_1453853 [Lactifluus volemus]
MQRVILRPSHRILIRHISQGLRSYASSSSPKPIPGPTKPYRHEKAPTPEQTWLTRKLKQSPTSMRVFLKIFGALGYGSSRQVAARRALALYQQLCASREEEDREFWAKVLVYSDKPPRVDAHNPPTCTPRTVLRPQSQSRSQPQARPATTAASTSSPSSSASTTPSPEKNISSNIQAGEPPKKRGAAPESLVKKQMKIFREQWAGLGLALDLALAHDSDNMLAAAIWRNLLGARVPAGGEPWWDVGNMSESALAREETRDDGSGVHDFGPEDRDAYVEFPETMLLLTTYIHGELTRLAAIPDEKIMGTGATLGREAKGVEELRFRKISSARAIIDNILEGREEAEDGVGLTGRVHVLLTARTCW